MTTADVATALGTVFDPELGIDIVALGLVYAIDAGETDLRVAIATTTPDCPMAGAIFAMAEAVLGCTFPQAAVRLELADDPPWNVHMAERAALQELGLAPA